MRDDDVTPGSLDSTTGSASIESTSGSDVPWWTRAVVYQIYPRSFADGNGDGVGDLAGIRQHLDHLARLGVDVLWLSPVYPSPQHDNGYDISDYEDIEPVFGTLGEFDALLDDVHARGMKLVMDLVVNHTSDEHAWFAESRVPASPKRDWYWWREGRGEHGELPPNGWRSVFGGPAWTRDAASGQWYLHMFAPQQPDLNWENPAVRAEVFAMMNRWLDRGVDGFRMDVIDHIAKHPDSFLPEASGWVVGDQAHEYLAEMHREVFAHRDADLITVGEMPMATIDRALLFTARERRELDMVFQFEHVGLDHGPSSKFEPGARDLAKLKASLAKWQTGLADAGWNSLYLDNHDQPRAVSRFGDDAPAFRIASAKTLATVLHLHRGTPYVYQGEEIGMPNAGFTRLDEYRDLESLNHATEAAAAGRPADEVLADLARVSRDNARTPMPWTDEPHHGWSGTAPWIGFGHAAEVTSVARDDAAGDESVSAWFRRLIALRHESATVQLGAFALLEPEHPALWAFTREWQGETLLVLANCASAELSHPLVAEHAGAEVLLATHTPHPDAATLHPWESRVVRPHAD